jgi:deoxyribodipyrimidine photolyase-related protein
MISPQEVIDKAVNEWQKRPKKSTGRFRSSDYWMARIYAGIYWLKMPEYASLNYFNNQEKLPEWFWTGETK